MESPKLPEIKGEVQKDRDDKKPGLAGLLARFGLGGGGAAGGLGSGGGFGSLGGLGGAGFAGGLLATKAGVIGLALVGTTVAGGIGVIGYKMFGPGSEGRGGGAYSLFAPRPPSPAPAEGEGQPHASGESASLNYLVRGNPPSAAPAPAAEAAAAAAQAPAAAAAGAIGTGQSINANVLDNKGAAAAGRLKSDKKFGELSKTTGGGHSGATLSSGLPDALTKGGKLGATGNFARNVPAGGRGLLRRLGGNTGGAYTQLGSVYRDQRGAGSSAQAGRTYDGGGIAGVANNSAADGGAGTGAGAGGKISNNPSNGGAGADRFPTPPAATSSNVTPWQSAINTAAMLLGVAALALFIGGKIVMSGTDKVPLTGWQKGIVMACAAIALLCSIFAIMLGSMIAGGAYGQKFQGNMFVLAGGSMSVAAGILAVGGLGAVTGETGPMVLMVALVISGAAGLGAAMTGYLSKPKVYPPSEFNGGRPPDYGIF